MLTFDDARRVLEAHFREHPPAISGTLYIAPEGFEDDTHYMPVWGAREYLVDKQEPFARWDNRVLFVDKQTGEISEQLHTLALDKVRAMRPVRVEESTPAVLADYFPSGFVPVGGRVEPWIVERFGENVSGTLEDAWQTVGPGTTPDGFIRLIDPGTLLPLMDTLVPSLPGAVPMFATAWGDLVVYHEEKTYVVLFRYGFYDDFLGRPSGYEFDALDERETQETVLQRSFYDQAVSVLGVPAIDECFGFVAPLALGGAADVSNVARRKLKEHLVFLVQAGGAPRHLREVSPPR